MTLSFQRCIICSACIKQHSIFLPVKRNRSIFNTQSVALGQKQFLRFYAKKG